MSGTRARFFPVNRWLEPLLALITVGAVMYAMWHLLAVGYLPQPFFYDQYDTFMDWFNVSWWARNGSMYDVWASIYPPISFLITGLFGDPACYRDNLPPSSRTCDWVGMVAIHGFYLVAISLAARMLYRQDRRTALPRSVALAMGLPMLGALERGNLLLPTFIAVVLAFGPMVRSARLRWLALGIAVNLKVYLVASLAPLLIRRRWRWFEGAAIACVLVYFVSYALLGDGTPWQVVDNIVYFNSTRAFSVNLLDGWFAATYQPLLAVLDNPDLPIATALGSQLIDTLRATMIAVTRTAQAAILLGLVAAWLRPEAVPMHRLTNLGICLAMVTAESGFYTLIFPVLFTFTERWEGFGRKWAIVTCYLLCIPLDLPLNEVPPTVQDVFWLGGPMQIDYSLTLGPFLRPALAASIPTALACVTIRQVWQDIDRQGWKQRWRFRRDLPIMVGEGPAEPPAGTVTTPR